MNLKKSIGPLALAFGFISHASNASFTVMHPCEGALEDQDSRQACATVLADRKAGAELSNGELKLGLGDAMKDCDIKISTLSRESSIPMPPSEEQLDCVIDKINNKGAQTSAPNDPSEISEDIGELGDPILPPFSK